MLTRKPAGKTTRPVTMMATSSLRTRKSAYGTGTPRVSFESPRQRRAMARRRERRSTADQWVAVPVLLLVRIIFILLAPSIASATQNGTRQIDAPKLESDIQAHFHQKLNEIVSVPRDDPHQRARRGAHLGDGVAVVVRHEQVGATQR